MKTMKLSTAFVSACVILTIGWKCFQPGEQADVPQESSIGAVKPDTKTRQLVEGISTKDVIALHFFGIHFGCFENDPIEVTDKKLIALFLEALRQAEGRYLGNRVDVLQIHLKPDGKREDMIPLSLSPLLPEDSFGPKFRQALRSLAKYRAGQMQEYVRRNSSRIEKITIHSLFSESKPHIITNVQKIKALAKSLQEVDERAFAFTDPPFALALVPAINIKLRGGEERDFIMRLGQQDKKPPLPAPLWKYVNKR